MKNDSESEGNKSMEENSIMGYVGVVMVLLGMLAIFFLDDPTQPNHPGIFAKHTPKPPTKKSDAQPKEPTRPR